MALTNSMKIIPSQFQISAKNRHYKIANTYFYFFCYRLKLTPKWRNESAKNVFVFYGLLVSSAEKYLNEKEKIFFWSSP